jgi:hypothetical protein
MRRASPDRPAEAVDGSAGALLNPFADAAERFRSRLLAWQQRRFRDGVAPIARHAPEDPLRVLVLGIYLTDRANQAPHLMRRFAESTRHAVTQRWAAIGEACVPAECRDLTVCHRVEPVAKFKLLNEMLAAQACADFDYLLFTDDDIAVQHGFVDAYLSWLQKYRLCVAQPARTRHSYHGHRFVLQRRFVRVRETRFVEIGPLFSFDRQAVTELLPFDETSPMGWGYDYVWPARLQQLGRRMGIVDATPVDHSYRAQYTTYSLPEHRGVMKAFLSRHSHVPRKDAMVNLKYHFW